MKGLKTFFAVFAATAVLFGGIVNAAQVDGGNIYYSKNLTTNSAYGDPTSAKPCETVQLKVRLHNGGPEVLTNVNVKLSIPSAKATSFSSSAVTTSSNGNPSVISDTAAINSTEATTLSYVAGSAKLLDANSGLIKSLSDSVVSGGVDVGAVGVSTQQIRFVTVDAKLACIEVPPVDVCPNIDGVQTTVPAGMIKDAKGNCVTLPVDVCPNIPGVQTTVPAGLVKDSNGNCVEKPKVDVCPNIDGVQTTVPEGFEKDSNGNCVEKVVISTAECKATDVKIGTGRNVTVAINTTVNNATIVGYKIDFGDGTTANTQTANHTYTKDGTYKIVGSVEVKFADGTTRSVNADNCVKNVTFKADEPPVVVPTPVTPVTPIALPNTGAGSIAAIFGAVTTIATLAFSVVSRRFGRQL